MVVLVYLAKTGLCRSRSEIHGWIGFAIARVFSRHLRGVEWGYFYLERCRAEARPTGTFTSSQLKSQTCKGSVLHSTRFPNQQLAQKLCLGWCHSTLVSSRRRIDLAVNEVNDIKRRVKVFYYITVDELTPR